MLTLLNTYFPTIFGYMHGLLLNFVSLDLVRFFLGAFIVIGVTSAVLRLVLR